MKRLAMLTSILLLLLPAASRSDSWAQINQPLGKPGDWAQIVLQSPFALGGEVTAATPDGESFTQIGFGAYPSIDGSTVAVPMALEFARQHLSLSEIDLAGFVSFSTTHHAYENLIYARPNGAPILPASNVVMDSTHPVDLIIATGPSEEELALASAEGVTLLTEPVCFDAFVFITHVDNPIDSLTIAQIQDIYSGRVVHWADVGGEDDYIRVFQREPNSGSQTAMERMVMQGRPMTRQGANMFIVYEMSDLVSRVGGYRNDTNSIGYTYQYYLNKLYQDEAVKVLAVDGIAPTVENVRSGAYPYSTHYYGVIRAGEEEATAGQFLDWMLSDEGQRCIAQAGYIPLKGQEDRP